jgi:hypothetical protein
MFRRALATTAVVAALAISAAPASAADQYKPAPAGTVAITVTGAYTGVFVSGLQIVANCDAVAAGAVSAIVIDQCYLTSNGINHPSTLPGNATSSNFVERVGTLEFTLCFHAYAIPITDPTHPAVAGGCATLNTGGAGGDTVDLSGLGGLGSAVATN